METTGLTHLTNGSRLVCMAVGKPLPNVTCKACLLLLTSHCFAFLSFPSLPPSAMVSFFQIQHLRREVALQKRKRGELCLMGPQVALEIPGGPKCAQDANNNDNSLAVVEGKAASALTTANPTPHCFVDRYGWLRTGFLFLYLLERWYCLRYNTYGFYVCRTAVHA